MRVKRKVLIPAEEGKSLFQVNTCYTNKDKLGLLQYYSELVASDTFGKIFQRRSLDNGRSWSKAELVFEQKKSKNGVLRWGENALFLDEDKEAILHFYNYHLYPDNLFSGQVLKYTRIFLRTSFDGGETFAPAFQLIQKGFDEKNWVEGVIFGENSVDIPFCAPLKTRGGKVLLPVQKVPLDSDFNHPFYIPWQASCLIGSWQGDNLVWDMGKTVNISSEISSRGLCEPTIAELSDGTLLMVCRGSNAGITHMSGYKWMATSNNSGWTWSEPGPFMYDTSEKFFSPATGSRLIRHSTGELYWIGNLTRENPNGNRPRYPLQIAQVNEEKRALVKDSIRIVEDKRAGDSTFVQFSNFKVYEDRKTKEFVLTMARIQERSESDLTSPAYEYRFIPE